MIRTTYRREGKEPIISEASRKAAQYGLASVMRLLAKASQSGALVYHQTVDEGCDVYHFQYLNGTTASLEVEVV